MNFYNEISYKELNDIIPELKKEKKGYKEKFKHKIKNFKNFYIIGEIEYLGEFVNPKYKININLLDSPESIKKFIFNELKNTEYYNNFKNFNYSSFLKFIFFLESIFEKDFNNELLKRYFIITDNQKIKTLSIFTFNFNK